MRLLIILPLLIVLCQCGAPQPPSCRFLPIGSRVPAAGVLATAKNNWEILSDPDQKDQWPAATESYNKAVAILFDKLRCGPGDWSTRAQAFGTEISKRSPTNEIPEKFDALFPASEVKLHRKQPRKITPGLGIPAVGWTATSPVGQPRPQFYPPTGQPRSLTAVLDFSTDTPQWLFSKRWIKNDYTISGNKHKLAANWTAPIDFYWQMSDLDDLRIQNVLIPDRFTDETGIFFLEPYNPRKIPVVMVHGLVSSPDAYRYIINELSPEPWFRENYQIWLYNYPTGTPWLYSSMKFRQNMKQAIAHARSKGPSTKLDKMVILSHSMGGLLTRTAISDPGLNLYNAHYNTPFNQLRVQPETRALLKEGLLYEPLQAPARVVFMAVPHKGSPMATFRGTGLLSKLIRLPKSLTVGLLDATLHSLQDNIEGDVALSEVRPPTSISSLSPIALSIKGLNNMPLPDDVTFHSIMGDKGQGDTPRSSDGVVPYWSSHVAPVATELIVPSNHSVPNHPAACAEVCRILRLHLEEQNILSPDNDSPDAANN